jgi:hypothetical protein
MGGSLSSTRCDSSKQSAIEKEDKFVTDSHLPMEAPPVMQRPMSFEEKLYAKVCLLLYAYLFV